MAENGELLTEILSLVESAEDEGTLDEKFCGALTRIFDAEQASILDYHEKEKVLRFRYSMDLNEAERGRFYIRLGEGICGVAAYTGRTMAVENAMETYQTAAKMARETGLRVRTMLATPAIRRGRCVAVIEVMNRRKGPFTDEERQLMRALAALYALRRPEPATRQSARGDCGAPSLPEERAILGSSGPIEASLQLAVRAAGSDVPVLILGESGTGKELFARRIHEASARADKPFVAINCAALADSLLESELFGHLRGAFTGAHQNRIGRLEAANLGTVFLDEIGDVSPACQAKLLRALDSGEISPLGSNQTRRIDVRFIAATNRPIEEMMTQGGFRPDLYYRLCGVDLRLPPLRERRDDIPLLAEVFLRRAALKSGRMIEGFEPEAMRALQDHPWPGNVRELRNAMERIVVMVDRGMVTRAHLPEAIGTPAAIRQGTAATMGSPKGSQPGGARAPDRHVERIIEALRETAYAGTGRWNIAEAARRLELPRKTLEYRLGKLGLRQDGR